MINECFDLAMSVCNAEYNATNSIPQKNATLWTSQPQCTHLLFFMYCQLGNFTATCPGMEPFCQSEYPYLEEDWNMTTYSTYTTSGTSTNIVLSPVGTTGWVTSTFVSTGAWTFALQSAILPTYTHKRRELPASAASMPTPVDGTPTLAAWTPASAAPAPTTAPGKK